MGKVLAMYAERSFMNYERYLSEACDYARDLALNEGCSWGLAIKIDADEYDLSTHDISAEFAARRAARKKAKEKAGA
jgi:hypothetical protein